MVRTYNTYERASLPNTSSRHGLTYQPFPLGLLSNWLAPRHRGGLPWTAFVAPRTKLLMTIRDRSRGIVGWPGNTANASRRGQNPKLGSKAGVRDLLSGSFL